MARTQRKTAEDVELPPLMAKLSNQPEGRALVRRIVTRIEQLETDRAAINADLTETYAEAKAEGLMVKVLRLVVRRRRRGRNEVRDEDELVRTYEDMLE